MTEVPLAVAGQQAKLTIDLSGRPVLKIADAELGLGDDLPEGLYELRDGEKLLTVKYALRVALKRLDLDHLTEDQVALASKVVSGVWA